MKPEDAAGAVLLRYWDCSLPVNPVAIAEKMGLKVFMADDMGDLGGYYEEESREITINAKDALPRQRFSVAHEIGHAALGHGSSPRTNKARHGQTSLREYQANVFAAALLMPDKALQVMVEHRHMRLAELCKTFGVSESAMTIRLRGLGYI